MENSTATTATETAAAAEQGANVAPEKAPSKKGATQKKGAPKSQKTDKGGKAKAKAAAPKSTAKENKPAKKASKTERPAKTTAPRAETKGAKLLAMIARPKGATLAELMKELSWQAHSIRGFISIVSKKKGHKIESSKNEAGDRLYKLVK